MSRSSSKNPTLVSVRISNRVARRYLDLRDHYHSLLFDETYDLWVSQGCPEKSSPESVLASLDVHDAFWVRFEAFSELFARMVFRPAICKLKGHDFENELIDGGDSGREDLCCRRCDIVIRTQF